MLDVMATRVPVATKVPVVGADTLTTWTKWLAIATFAAVAVAVIGLIWSIKSAKSERQAADRRLVDQKTNDDKRAERQVGAAKESAVHQVAAAQERLEAQRKADDERAERQIAAAKDAADRQIAEMQAQLDAANRPLLIEVAPNGPIYPDMGSRPNPNIRLRSTGEVPNTISVRFEFAGLSWPNCDGLIWPTLPSECDRMVRVLWSADRRSQMDGF